MIVIAKEQGSRRNQAWEIFKEHNGDIGNQELARLLGVSHKTISGWKSKDKWRSRLDEALQTGQGDCCTPPESSDLPADSLHVRLLELLSDYTGLTDKQRLFCIFYVGCYNATQAAIKAGYSRDTAGQIGYQLLQKTSIQEAIARLKGEVNEGVVANLLDVMQELSSIAYDDIGNYVEFRTERVQIGTDEQRQPIYDNRPVMLFRDSRTIDTRNISEVSMNDKGQLKIKLYNRDAALYRIAEIGLKLKAMEVSLLKLEAELGMNETESGSPESNFADALNAAAREAWADYDDEQ